jgi:hypothetical protein
MNSAAWKVSDLSYDEYMTRQFRELEPQCLSDRAHSLKPSPSYRYSVDGWVPQSYPGFAVISTVEENPGNDPLPAALTGIQCRLLQGGAWDQVLYPLPVDSFHQTIANNLSEDRFIQQVVQPGLEVIYPDLVAAAFKRIPSASPPSLLTMRLIGLSIFGNALGVLGVFDEESSYCQLTEFRAAFYRSPELSALGVRMTRPFIGHITLAYVCAELTAGQSDQLACSAHEINQRLAPALPPFKIRFTGLRRYHNLSSFLRSAGYPTYFF